MRASSATLASALLASLVLAACGGGTHEVVLHPASMTKCLEAQRSRPRRSRRTTRSPTSGSRRRLSFSFKNWSDKARPPQGLILFAADSKNAKYAQASLVSFLEQASGADAKHLTIRLHRNALVAWTTPGGGSMQDQSMVHHCLTPPAAG